MNHWSAMDMPASRNVKTRNQALKSILFLLVPVFGLFGGRLSLAQTPQYLIWDSGSKIGQVDSGDTIIDVTKGCDVPDQQIINLPGSKRASVLPQISAQPIEETQAILDAAHLPRSLAKDLQIPFSSQGSKQTVFVLLPEVHRAGTVIQEIATTIKLHWARTSAVLALFAKPYFPILNLSEGIVSRPAAYELSGLQSLNRDTAISMLVGSGADTYHTLATIFSREKKFVSSSVEQPLLPNEEMLLIYGDFQKGDSLATSRLRVEKVVGHDFDETELKTAHEALSKMSEDEIRATEKQICLTRGTDVATQAISRAQHEGAHLVFLTYGLSHHPQITAALLAAGYTYVTFIARLNP
jgi:hypothetical protein